MLSFAPTWFADVQHTPYNHDSAGPSTAFAFPHPSSSGVQHRATTSAQLKPEVDVAAYEAAGDTGLLTPTTSASPSTYLPSYQQLFSVRTHQLETLSKLDPLLHPAVDQPGVQPSVEEPGSPQDNSLVISSPRVATNNTTELYIRPSGNAASTGTVPSTAACLQWTHCCTVACPVLCGAVYVITCHSNRCTTAQLSSC